jgi:TolB protein
MRGRTMMALRILILSLSIFFTITAGAYSQIKLPEVTGPTIQKIPIFVPNLTSVGPTDAKGQEFADVLRNDLENAALFDVSTGGEIITDVNNISFQAFFDAGADYLIAGQYQTSGGKYKFAVQLFNVREERPILGRSYEATPGKVREAAHRFADLVMKQVTGYDGFFTSKIGFVQGGGHSRNLFLMDYDGANLIQLTRHNALVMSPDCSPDGTKIVFNSDKVWDQDLYIMDLVPSISEHRLTRAYKLEQSASWSPSGNQIAFSANGDIYVSGPSGKGAVNLTRSNAIDVSPTWSPDGSMIAFVSDRGGNPGIYIMSSSGGAARRISSGGYSTDPSWSPNPQVNRIAFVKVEGSGANIYTINPDGSDEQRLTSGSRNENPAWSPDGHYIAFSTSRNGAKDIFIMYMNGANQRPLSHGGGKSFPTWCK